MSCLKEDHALPKKSIALFERILAEKIMRELRLEYKDTRCAVKHISRRTGISFNTIKRWYNGHNLPVSQHLLVLTRHYNCALRAFLEASGNGYLIAYIRDENSSPKNPEIAQDFAQNVPINVPINPESARMERYQRWFLEAISHNMRPTAASLEKQWGISPRIAKSVINKLKLRKLIAFVGAKKNGRYVVL
jgi:transcriptional regulator with XRE-family HTH domain